MAIKNVVFDVGNVLVRWSPEEITRLTFGEVDELQALAKSLFHGEIWLDLNKGLMTEHEAKQRYQQQHALSDAMVERLFLNIKHTLTMLEGSQRLLERLKAAGYGVYALTDNVLEIVEYLKTTHDFWPLFDGAIVSAEEGVLKPMPEIYQALLQRFDLRGEETVFLDDMPRNVEGAIALGIHAIQFEDAVQGEHSLKQLGLQF
ncbi:HAD family hydrolase [Pseudoalteromonas fenneropenaei]|uniref:HAD family hydrolase n=1 Tax=Pseudoalteromonas fenneropenaei TaxID=1737459 RepID=A0ABV7CIB7_9GAMM